MSIKLETVKVYISINDLDEVDKQRILQHEMGAIAMWHYLFMLHQQNLLPEGQWQQQSKAFKFVSQRQAVRQAWEIVKNTFDKPFHDYVNEILD